MFRRRRVDPDPDTGPAVAPEVDPADRPDAEPTAPAPPPRPAGPWDVDDVPEDAGPYLDLGGLRLPVAEGMEVRVDVSEGQVVGVTLVDSGRGALSVTAFAAPRTSGIWADVAAEIAESLRGEGRPAEQVDGPFGLELAAELPQEGGAALPARFLGVDGPRWFLRGLLTGPAVHDAAAAARLLEAFRGVVVVRGGEAMAPRDPLPLTLPAEAMQAAEQAAAQQSASGDDFNPFERGPEITEIR